ncbi:hypothetical protein ACWCOV_40650 [Kribbella sp. NPDC002412]
MCSTRIAFQVGDGDLVACGDDEDLLEASSPVDHVLDLVQHEDAVAGQLLDGRRDLGSNAGAGLSVRLRRRIS